MAKAEARLPHRIFRIAKERGEKRLWPGKIFINYFTNINHAIVNP